MIEALQKHYFSLAQMQHCKKLLGDDEYNQIIKLLFSKDKDVIKLGTKKLKQHIWQ
tara:strand:+ start:2056 stop:2223 length:168 start_codon:yes stop_codon:yes gene_type:complete